MKSKDKYIDFNYSSLNRIDLITNHLNLLLCVAVDLLLFVLNIDFEVAMVKVHNH